jgi:hypothetical protein
MITNAKAVENMSSEDALFYQDLHDRLSTAELEISEVYF